MNLHTNKLLIVDDEENLRTVIREYAEYSGFFVDEAENGEEAVNMALDMDYDLIVMDIMMPIKDGFTASKEIREVKDTPIILLSARTEEYDKLFGFQLGIDDYVVKPFSPKELLARINAIITRHHASSQVSKLDKPFKKDAKNEILKFGGLVIDKLGRQVEVDNNKVELTPKEYDLLLYMVMNKNKAMSREKLLEEIWGYSFGGDDRTIDTHIKNLRNHLGSYRDFIVTLRGVGYKFVYER